LEFKKLNKEVKIIVKEATFKKYDDLYEKLEAMRIGNV